jgi:hypothetical protein
MNMLRRKIAGVTASAWFSYLTIFLLQLKIIWGVWRFRDLPSGDTSSYFQEAFKWFRSSHVFIAWSPLYTSFYGALLHVSSDAYVATMLHRVIIILALSILVLAFMRRLLPPGLAWAAAAWWVVLPIDFNSLYEVHLFAVIPVLLAFLAILWKPGPWGRGFGIAVLLASAFLMRNELLPAALLFAALCLGWEILRVRRGAAATRRLPLAYGLPVTVACMLVVGYYLRASDAGSLRPAFSRKHTLNICQVYAFGYEQRHSDWQGSPWTECQQLMTRIYGVPEPSLTEALGRNPSAMLEHFWWNVELIPNGLEVLLVNGMSGRVNPDYVFVSQYSWALPLCLLMSIIGLSGSFVLYRDRQYWWRVWLKDRIWAWIAIACVACVVPGIVITQRPRPSYLLAFGITLRAAVGMCVFVLLRRYPRFTSLDRFVPLFAIPLLVFSPAYYTAANATRTLADLYQILIPFHEWIERPDAGLVTPGYSQELCSYVGHSRGCRAFTFADIRRQVTPDAPLHQVLDNNRASVFFADRYVLADPLARSFVSEARSYGWRVIATRHDTYRDWDLLVKLRSVAPALPGEPQPLDENVREIADPAKGIDLGAGWHGFEVFQGSSFRWVNNDAEINFAPITARPVALHFIVEPGPGLNGKPLELRIFSGGDLLETVKAVGRQILSVELPKGCSGVRLHTDSENKPTPNDQRILNFRVFRIWTD